MKLTFKIFGQTTCPNITRDVHSWRQNHQTKRKQQHNSNHDFKFLYSTFANSHICGVLQSSVHHRNVQNSCINPDITLEFLVVEQIDHFVHWFWNGEGLSYHFCLIDQNGVLDALGYGVCVAQAHQIPCIQCRFLDLTHLCSWQRTDLQQAQ